jgi:hypothetical protein
LAGVAAVLMVRDMMASYRRPKLLEISTLLFFDVITWYAPASGVQWSISAVHLYVDAWLLLIVRLTMALCRPFSLQYARKRGPAESG